MALSRSKRIDQIARRLGAWGALGAILGLSLMAGLLVKGMRARQQAQSFCDATPIGSDVTATKERYDKVARTSKLVSKYTSLDSVEFPFGAGGPYCVVWLDASKHVVGKKELDFVD